METATPTELLTQEEIDAEVLKVYREAGRTRTTRTGEIVRDTDALKDSVFAKVTSRVVNTRAEMSTKSWTPGELYAEVFPNGPGSDPKQNLGDLSALDLMVRKTLIRQVWTNTDPSRKGAIQSRLGKEGRTEVLVRTKVQRGVDEIIGAFITNDPKLIIDESVQPMVEKLYGVAREVRLHNDLVVEARHPELSGQLAKILDVAKRRVTAELARPASNGSQAALGTGSSDPGAAAD
jgi:hypothetical protein